VDESPDFAREIVISRIRCCKPPENVDHGTIAETRTTATSVKTMPETIETHRDERQRELASVEPRATARG